MAEPKIYVGSGKKHPSYDITSISVCLSDIPKEYITESKNGKKYVNLSVSAKKETDQYGKTHSVAIDTFKPQNQEGKASEAYPIANDTNDLPW